MKKLLGAITIALSAVIMMAGVADAAITQFSITSATLNTNNNAVIVNGTITCQAGRVAKVQVSVDQGTFGQIYDGDAYGSSKDNRIVCTGSQQTWRVSVLADVNGPFHSGPAEVCASATERRESDGLITDRAPTQCTVVNL